MVKKQKFIKQKTFVSLYRNKSFFSTKLLFSLIETTFTYIGTTTHEPKR